MPNNTGNGTSNGTVMPQNQLFLSSITLAQFPLILAAVSFLQQHNMALSIKLETAGKSLQLSDSAAFASLCGASTIFFVNQSLPSSCCLNIYADQPMVSAQLRGKLGCFLPADQDIQVCKSVSEGRVLTDENQITVSAPCLLALSSNGAILSKLGVHVTPGPSLVNSVLSDISDVFNRTETIQEGAGAIVSTTSAAISSFWSPPSTLVNLTGK